MRQDLITAYQNDVSRRRRRIAASFTPEALGSLLLAHWSADDTGLITVTGLGVSSWKDRVNAYDMVQPTDAARPPYAADSFNGSPGLTFAAADFLTLTPNPFPRTFEAWGLVQQDALVGDAQARVFFAAGGETAVQQRVARVSGNLARITTNNAAVATTTELMEGRQVIRATFSDGVGTVQLNEGAVHSGAATLTADTTRARIGGSTAGVAAAFWNGVMRDVIITEPLILKQANALRSYLMARRNL